jgi:hypothetical protein
VSGDQQQHLIETQREQLHALQALTYPTHSTPSWNLSLPAWVHDPFVLSMSGLCA